MTTIKIETETITTDLTPSVAAATIKEALGIAEFPQMGDTYWSVNDRGYDVCNVWQDTPADRYCLSHGNCSPTPDGLAWYKGDMAKYAAIVAIRKHCDKTFGTYEPRDGEWRAYGIYSKGGEWLSDSRLARWGGIAVPFRTQPDIERSFAECGEHWEVLK